ncbi:hypothetical protein ACFL2J_02765 [Candidatus Omnitrophota bacterium]
MKRVVLIVAIFLGFSLLLGNLGIGSIYAAQDEKRDPVELDGTEWDIQLRHTTAKGKQTTIPDKLIFENGKFNSENQEDKGYKSCNYTLSVKGDATVFETMQTKDKDKVFWRGDVRGRNIRGVLSSHPERKANKDYRFNGALVSGDIEETRGQREARLAAEKAAKDAKEAAAKATEKVAAKATEETAVKATEEVAVEEAVQSDDASANDQVFGDKVKQVIEQMKELTQEEQE